MTPVSFRCSFSLWVLLDEQCTEHLCGVLHHIDTRENYASPSLFLARSGESKFRRSSGACRTSVVLFLLLRRSPSRAAGTTERFVGGVSVLRRTSAAPVVPSESGADGKNGQNSSHHQITLQCVLRCNL